MIQNGILFTISPQELQELIEKSVRTALISYHNNDHPPPESSNIEYLSRNETCKILKISLPSLRKLYERDSVLKAYRLGGKIMFIKSEVHEALKVIPNIKHSRRNNGY